MQANLEKSAVAIRLEKVSFHSNLPKNVQTTAQLHSSPMLVRLCLKSYMLGFSIMQTKNFQMSKLGLGKAEEPEIKLPISAGSSKKQDSSRKTFTSAY